MRRNRRNRMGDDRGFTLLELLVVLAIMMVVTGSALAFALRKPAGLELRATASDMASLARRARTQALQQNAEAVMLVDVAKGSYWIDGSRERAELPEGIRASLTIAAPEQRSSDLGGIRFFADGSSTGGDIRLEGPGGKRTIAVDWLLGLAEVRDE